MTIPAQLVTDVNTWVNYEYSEEQIESWVRIGFERISETLRCDHMIKIVTGQLEDNRVLLPTDWLEADFIRFAAGMPVYYKTRDDFFRDEQPTGYYTLTGRYLQIGGEPGEEEDAILLEMAYFATLPTTFDEQHFMFSRYYSLTLFATLAASAAFSEDNEAAAKWSTAVADAIDKANATYRLSKASGSKLRRTRAKGFG